MVSYPEEYYERSRELLNIALDSVPAYREWREYDPGRDRPVDERYAALPYLHKSMIRKFFPDGFVPAEKDVRKALATGEIDTASTSGSSDISVTNIWNQAWWDASERSSWKLNTHAAALMTGDHPEAILANPLNVGVRSDNSELPLEKRRLDRFLFLNEMTDPARWSPAHMDRMIAELAMFRPVVLEANPSFLARLCRYAAAEGKEVYQPGLITFTYEYPSALHYRQIRQVFQSPTASSYGSTETGYVFMQCEHGRFHQNTDFCRVDFQPFRNEYGGPSLGRLLITTFGNPWYYMLRFDIRDLVRIDEFGSCPCGRDFGMILSAVEGRTMSLTLTCDGRPVTLRMLDETVAAIEEIDEYSLVQTSKDTYVLSLVSHETDHRLTKDAMNERLRDLYGRDADISITFADSLSPADSGKYVLARSDFPIDIDSLIA